MPRDRPAAAWRISRPRLAGVGQPRTSHRENLAQLPDEPGVPLCAASDRAAAAARRDHGRRRDFGALQHSAFGDRLWSRPRHPAKNGTAGNAHAAARRRYQRSLTVQDVASDRTSPTEDGFAGLTYEARRRQSEQTADEAQDAPDYLKLMREARQRGQTYYTENLQGPVDTNYRAFRNKHFAGSKYWSTDYRNRSKLFRPKTRSAVRKANAAAISALFSSVDAIKCSAGDDSNPLQKANAAL